MIIGKPLGILVVLLALISSGMNGNENGNKIFQITGLVIDETRTKVGNDFFYFFTNKWDAVEGDYTVTIHELADPRSGSIISIQVNDTLVYRNRVLPRLEDIEEEAKKGVEITKRFVVEKLDLLKELERY